MPKPHVLVICPPDHYVLRGLGTVREAANVWVGNDLSKVEGQAAQADIILYSGLTGQAVPLKDLWPYAKKVRWIHSLAAGVEKVLFPPVSKVDDSKLPDSA